MPAQCLAILDTIIVIKFTFYISRRLFTDGFSFDGFACVCVCAVTVHISRRRLDPDEKALTTDCLARRLDHCNTEQLSAVFDGATADQQSEIIRYKLRALQRRLADEDYAALAHLFRHNLRQAAVRPPPTVGRRAAKAAVDACVGQMETLARRVMFSTVLGMESRLRQTVSRRRAFVAQQTAIHYHDLVSGLIHHGSAAEVETGDHDDGCFSSRLDQLLRDLADIDLCQGGGSDTAAGLSDRDRDAMVAMTAELSLGWLAGSTTLQVAGQRTVVPNVSDLRYQKLLLYGAALSPSVTPLSASDVDELLVNCQTSCYIEHPPLPVPDVILAELGGHVYRLLHGLERCCGLDSPSCVLSGLVVYDRLCRLYQCGSLPAGTQKTAVDGKVDARTSSQSTAAVKDQRLCNVSVVFCVVCDICLHSVFYIFWFCTFVVID